MEMFSPQPEHAQLNTGISNSKASVDMSTLLQSNILGSVTENELSQDNSKKYQENSLIDKDNLSSQSSKSMGSNSTVSLSNPSVGSTHTNTPHFDFRYNAPMRSIIDTSFFNSPSFNASTNNDPFTDEQLILSPPLSPKVQPVDSIKPLQEHVSPIKPKKKGIYVKNCWTDGMSSKSYLYLNNQFLSEYRAFNYSDSSQRNKYKDPSYYSQRTTKRGRVIKSNLMSLERAPKIKRRGVETSYFESDNDDSVHESSKTITNRLKKTNPNVSSPLASATAVNSAPQYIPNMSWEKLIDYSPSTSTLPNDNVKCMKVEWKGSPMDLSHDPLKHKLHPAELFLAQILRLPCDLYLDSKRRLFLEKMYRYKKGLPFRRTDAQKACRIDVNKASRLYAAFEKVGWLEDTNFDNFL